MMSSLYKICSSEEDFKLEVKNHYHGDDDSWTYSSSPCVGIRTIWKCPCGYKIISNTNIKISLSDVIDKKN